MSDLFVSSFFIATNSCLHTHHSRIVRAPILAILSILIFFQAEICQAICYWNIRKMFCTFVTTLISIQWPIILIFFFFVSMLELFLRRRLNFWVKSIHLFTLSCVNNSIFTNHRMKSKSTQMQRSNVFFRSIEISNGFDWNKKPKTEIVSILCECKVAYYEFSFFSLRKTILQHVHSHPWCIVSHSRISFFFFVAVFWRISNSRWRDINSHVLFGKIMMIVRFLVSQEGHMYYIAIEFIYVCCINGIAYVSLFEMAFVFIKAHAFFLPTSLSRCLRVRLYFARFLYHIST